MTLEPRPNQIRSLNLIREFLGRQLATRTRESGSAAPNQIQWHWRASGSLRRRFGASDGAEGTGSFGAPTARVAAELDDALGGVDQRLVVGDDEHGGLVSECA